ncbi:ABC transporter ATP-binding protein [Spiroplasma litorale]|uniref:ABC transporter ATP-binding protein n=1 Tax=Spiroplasma litorale TaxID=216942 RepID=A0A0K1W375_9MOLU|nr:hypothetical protein [Spiroplasma litorale]AKX34641.1 ABC transporter ATP-binding protein [Spiroplasma litorale]
MTNKFKFHKKNNKKQLSYDSYDIEYDISNKPIIEIVGNNKSGYTTNTKAIFNELKINANKKIININKNSNNFINYNYLNNNILPLNMKVNKYIKQICSNNINKKQNIKILKNLLSYMNIKKHTRKKIKNLTFQQARQVIIACTLIIELDHNLEREINLKENLYLKNILVNIIKAIKKEEKTIIIASHISNDAHEINNYLILVEFGNILHISKLIKNQNIINLYNKKIKNQNPEINNLQIV